MGILDSIYDSVSGAWNSAATKLFGPSDADLVKANLNRIFSVSAGLKETIDAMKANRVAVPAALQTAYDDHNANCRQVLIGISTADRSAIIYLPTELGFGGIACVRTAPMATWKQQVQNVSTTVGVNGLGALGILPLIPIVIAIVVLALSAVAVTYLLTAEGRARMDIALASANKGLTLAKAIQEGKVTAAEAAEFAAQSKQDVPDAGGGLFGDIGKTVMIGAVGLVGLVFLANKFGGGGSSFNVTIPKLSGTNEYDDLFED